MTNAMEFKICRICLEDTASVCVFEELDGLQHSTKIMRCCNVTITEGDGLPNKICVNCITELTVAYRFILKCEASDHALHKCSVNHNFTNIQQKTNTNDKMNSIDLSSHEQQNNFNEVDDFILDIDSKEESTKEIDIDVKCKTNKIEKEEKQVKKKVRRQKLGPMPCPICGLLTSSRSAMDIHMRIHTGEKPFNCKFCSSAHPSKGSLKRHIATHHSCRERKFTCESCGNSFYSKNDIISHIRTHTDERPYVCTYCSRGFRQIASLNRHKRVHTREKPFSCPICDKKFGDKCLVKKHLSVHSDERKFVCHICSKSVKTKTALKTHLLLHTNKKQLICSFCGMAFFLKGNLKTHMQRVHSEKSGHCSECHKAFSDLEAHMRKHTGEKPFTCGACNQAFMSKGSLAHHFVFKHQTKFKCSIGECEKTFPNSMMLEFHLLKQHTNHTPYVCQYCTRGFFRGSDLSRHQKIHHINKNSIGL